MTSFLPVYLLRKGNPDGWARAFLASFFGTALRADTRLLILAKGFGSDEKPTVLDEISLSWQERIDVLHLNDEGYDLAAYRKACAAGLHSHHLFFNSHSRVLASNWQAAFETAIEQTRGTGLIGASGSLEGGLDGEEANAHIRTNGFLISARTYLELAPEDLTSKEACHAFEHGNQSLTSLVQQRGEPVMLVNSDLAVFQPKDWSNSGTFRLGNQEKLLVADNRSDKYHCGTNRRRRHHAAASWGVEAKVPDISMLTAVGRRLWHGSLQHGYRWPWLARMRGWGQ